MIYVSNMVTFHSYVKLPVCITCDLPWKWLRLSRYFPFSDYPFSVCPTHLSFGAQVCVTSRSMLDNTHPWGKWWWTKMRPWRNSTDDNTIAPKLQIWYECYNSGVYYAVLSHWYPTVTSLVWISLHTCDNTKFNHYQPVDFSEHMPPPLVTIFLPYSAHTAGDNLIVSQSLVHW